jgi:hypothetical protein
MQPILGGKPEVIVPSNPRHAIDEKEFGTNWIRLRERKNGPLVPKRHQMKHLDFLILLLESKQSI